MAENFLRILVCPLDWGLGHATRCVPVITKMVEEGHQVTLAADGQALGFLRGQFPDLPWKRFPGVTIRYPSGKSMVFKILLQLPAIFLNIILENQRIKKIAGECRADVILSDNRFGLWHKKIHTIYMTHQVMIKAPDRLKWAEPWLYRIHLRFIRKYDECWIPDFPGEPNLSGDLAHQYPVPPNGLFIGPLSRFTAIRASIKHREQTGDPALMVMISGPEPQRSIFENIILRQLRENPGINAVILRGLPGEVRGLPALEGVRIFNHLPDIDLLPMILNANTILCRSGYSTIMDLATLGRKAVLVATPGQTEQEYLANYLQETAQWKSVNQNDLMLRRVMDPGNGPDEGAETIRGEQLLYAAVRRLRTTGRRDK